MKLADAFKKNKINELTFGDGSPAAGGKRQILQFKNSTNNKSTGTIELKGGVDESGNKMIDLTIVSHANSVGVHLNEIDDLIQILQTFRFYLRGK